MGINGFLQAERSSLLAWKMLSSPPGACPCIMLQFFSKQLWPRQPRVIWVVFSFQRCFINQQSWWSISSTGESELALQAPLCQQAVAVRARGSGLSPGSSHTRREQRECSLVSGLLPFQLLAVNRRGFPANLALLPPQQCLSCHPLSTSQLLCKRGASGHFGLSIPKVLALAFQSDDLSNKCELSFRRQSAHR